MDKTKTVDQAIDDYIKNLERSNSELQDKIETLEDRVDELEDENNQLQHEIDSYNELY